MLFVPPGVMSVAGRKGAVVLSHSDLSDWASATSSFLTTSISGAIETLTFEVFQPAPTTDRREKRQHDSNHTHPPAPKRGEAG